METPRTRLPLLLPRRVLLPNLSTPLSVRPCLQRRPATQKLPFKAPRLSCGSCGQGLSAEARTAGQQPRHLSQLNAAADSRQPPRARNFDTRRPAQNPPKKTGRKDSQEKELGSSRPPAGRSEGPLYPPPLRYRTAFPEALFSEGNAGNKTGLTPCSERHELRAPQKAGEILRGQHAPEGMKEERSCRSEPPSQA